MARTHGRVQTTIWTDDDFRALSVSGQRAYLMLISQPQINNCGVLPYVPRRWVKMACGDTLEALKGALGELEDDRFIVVDEDTDELLVRTFIRHDRIERQPNLVKAALREFTEVESRLIRHVLYKQNEPLFEPLPEPLRKGLSEPLPEPLSERTRTRSRAHTPTPPAPTPTPAPTPFVSKSETEPVAPASNEPTARNGHGLEREEDDIPFGTLDPHAILHQLGHTP